VYARPVYDVIVGWVGAGLTGASERIVGTALNTDVEALSKMVELPISASGIGDAFSYNCVQVVSTDAQFTFLGGVVVGGAGQANLGLRVVAALGNAVDVDVGGVIGTCVGISLPGKVDDFGIVSSSGATEKIEASLSDGGLSGKLFVDSGSGNLSE
jgi:hypothetical protein